MEKKKRKKNMMPICLVDSVLRGISIAQRSFRATASRESSCFVSEGVVPSANEHDRVSVRGFVKVAACAR